MRSRAVATWVAIFLSINSVGIRAFDDSSAFFIEVSESQSYADPSSCDAPEIPYTYVPPPVGNAIREVDRGPGDPPLASTEHRFSDADGNIRVPYQFNTSSRYANLSIHEVVGHVHSRSGFDVVVLEMNRLTTSASSSIRPDLYFDTRENISFPMRSNNASIWSEHELQDSVRSGGGPFTNTEFRAGALDSVNHLFVTLIANRTSLFMLTFPSDAGAPDTQSATSVNDVRLPADLPPLAHITGLQFDNYTQIFYGAALSLAGDAYVLSLTPATELDVIYRDCSLPKRSSYPARLCDRVSIKEFLANGTRADFQRSAVIVKHHTIASATAISLTAFDRASRIFVVIVMNGGSATRPCADNYTSSFDLVGVRVTALLASQRQAFRVRIEGDAAVAMECDNLLGTCFLLRLRSKVFEYVKFSSVTGEILRVLIAPTLRQDELLVPHQFAVGVGSFDAFENRFLTLSIQDIAEMSPSDKFLLDQYDSNVSKAQLSNLTELQVFNSASDDVKLLLARRNPAYGYYYNLPPPLLPYRYFGGADSQVPEFPPTDEMSRVHTFISGAKVNNLITPNFLDTLGPIAEDEAAFIPPDPLEDKIFIDSSTYDVNSTRKVVTMMAYEFSDRPFFSGTVGGISVASVLGGLAVTVVGDHFQPSGFAVARFTDVQSWFAFYSSLKYINKTHAVFYTPRIPSASATQFQVSNNGFIFVSPASSGLVQVEEADEGFSFYEVSSRRPISGSSIGRTGVILRGAFLQKMVKAKASCLFAPCDSLDVQSPTLWSEELQAAVCFSPPISRRCSESYIASAFRILVGYEVIVNDIWFYVEDDGPSILQAQFDPSLRSIVVRFRSSTNVGSYNRSESCSKLFTVQSQFFILPSSVAYWPEPFTLILLLDQSHKLRLNSIIEFSNGGDITDASDKSLTLAGAVLFAAPPFIEPPTLVLSCPSYVLSNTDVFISAQHSYGLTVQNVSFSWNVSIITDFGFSKSLDFTIVQENVIYISSINLSSLVMSLESPSGSIYVHTQFTAFFNGSTGRNSSVTSNISSNSSFQEPSLMDSPQCSKFKTVQDAVKNGSATCISWQQVSSKCVSQVLLPQPEYSPKIRIDRPFNSSFTVPSDSEVFFRSTVTVPFQNIGSILTRWKVTTKKSALIRPQLQTFCEMTKASSATNLGSSFVNVSGPLNSSSCLKGTSGLSVIFAGNESEKLFNINLPFDFRWFSKTYNGNVFVGSHSYVVFGGNGTEKNELNGSNPLLPTLFVGSTNISMLLLLSGLDSTGWRVRFEGTHGISGTTSNSSIVWELLFKLSGGLELCTGTLSTQATSVSAISDGIQPPALYTIEPFSLVTFAFDNVFPNSSDPISDFCDLNDFIKMTSTDLSLTGSTMLLPRYSLPPGSYDIFASLSILSNCSWVNYSNGSSGDVQNGDSSSVSSSEAFVPDKKSQSYECEEKLLHSDSVNMQIIGVHSSPVTYINGAVSSGSPFFVESGALVCIEFDMISSCQITKPTAFSESFKPLDPDFEDLQSSFSQIISKSRQYLSLDADDLVLLNSSEFSRLFCSRCNGQISTDVFSYITRFFDYPTSDFQSADSDRSGIDDAGVSFEFIPTSNVTYTLEQVCFEHFYLNTTHFTRNCSMFLNATRTNIKKYLNDSEPLGFSLQYNVLSVESIFICQYNFSYFNVLLKDPSVYSTRLNPLYYLQWSCVIRPAKEPSSGYHSKSPYDTPCSNFTSSPYYSAAIFFDKINTSMVARISCTVLSNHVTWHMPAHAVVVLYPFLLRSVTTQQMIPVNPSLSALSLDNIPVQRAHLLRYSNSSSPYITLNSNPNFDFSFASAVRWDSRVMWLSNLSSSLFDSMFSSNSFLLGSQLSVPSSLLSLGFNYVFRASHFFRGQLSGFSEIVVNMSAPFFHGKASVSQLPSGLYQISAHRIEVNAEDRPLQILFLQSLDFDITLQPFGFSQIYTGPIYNTFQNNSVASIVILTRTASLSTVRTYALVSLSSGPMTQVDDFETILNDYRQSSADFFVTSQRILQTYRVLSATMNLSPLLSLSEGVDRDVNSIQTFGDLFEKRFLEPIVQLLCMQYFFSQGDLQLFIPREVDFTKILETNSTAKLLNFAVPGVQGAEHIAAVIYEGFRIYANGSIPSSEACERIIFVISGLVDLDVSFSSVFSSSLFGVLARCLDSDVAKLYDTMTQIATFKENSDTTGSTNNTFSSNSSVSESAAPNSESSSVSLADRQNPPRRSFLSGMGTIYGTCFMRVGALDSDLSNNEKGYSILPAIGDPSTWNVVFQSTLIISPQNLSVYRFFSKGSNQPLTSTRVDTEYKSNAFGGSWSDSDVVFASDVANSSRISGLWGGPGTGLTALFKFFDQPDNFSRPIVLVELGWVSLDQGKGFDSTNRSDVDLLTYPFDNSWNVTQAQSDLQIAPYRCQYPIRLNSSAGALPASAMAPNKFRAAGNLRSQMPSSRQLLQQLSLIDLQSQLKLNAATVVNNALNDFDAVCTRIRETSSMSGAPVSFSYSGTVVFSRNFYTRAGVTFETPQFTDQGVSCSSVAVLVNSVVPKDPSLDFHRSSLCIGVTVKDLTPSSQSVGGNSGAKRISSSCTILYKMYHGTYDRLLGIITSTVSLSYFTFLSVWARTSETKALCQFYQDSTNSFTTFGVPTTPPTEEIVSSFELLPNRTAAQVCKISQYAPLFSITSNRVTCRFNIKSAASVVPSQGLLGTFQEYVDCTGAMSGKGTMCDGCEVCFGNGSTCNADCDTAVASGRKFDDCQLCGGSTFYHLNTMNGLPWMPAVQTQTLVESDFKSKYCEATRVFAQPPDPQNIVTQENLILPRNKVGRENHFALDTTCFLMFEDLPSRIPIGIASVSGQNTYQITVDIIGGFIGYSEIEVLEKHGNSTECLRICDKAVASYIIDYRNCSVGIDKEKVVDRCGEYQSPLCNCPSGVQSLKLPNGPNQEYFSFRRSPAPLPLSETATSASKLYYFSPTQSIWIIPFNDKNTNNVILPNSQSIPCDSRTLQSLSSDEVWTAAAKNYSNAITDRDQGINTWTHSLFPDSMPKLLLRFSLTLNEPREVDWEILERKVMSFYVQPVNDAPRIVVPPNDVPVSEDSLTPVPDLLLFDDGKDVENVSVTFTLDRGFATSFQGLVASDDMQLENVFASMVPINQLESFIRKFRLVSPDNFGPGNFDSVRVDVVETRPAGFGKPLSTSATFKIIYTKQEIPDLPNVFLSVPGSQISLTENSHFPFDSLGVGNINGTDPSGSRNGIDPPTSISLKISCRGPFGLLFVPQSSGRRILGNSPAPSCVSEVTGLQLFFEYQGKGQFCRDVQIFGLADQIESQARTILYFAFRYDFSLLESSSVVLTVIGPPSSHPINRDAFIVNENKVFFRVSVLFVSNSQLGANVSRVFSEPWAVLQGFSPPITWAFEDTPARFLSELSQFSSELSEQLYEITISSRLNRVYISPPYRDSVNFDVGLGLAPENRIVFQASSVLVREALRHVMYISKKNYNTQFDKSFQTDPCHRHCFAFNPASSESSDSECTPMCRDFMSQYLSSKVRTNNLILDDIMIDFNDLGSGGLGVTRFSTKLHVPLFVAAINDGPCLSFLGSVFVNCFDSSGNAILSSPSFNFEMDEGTSLSISLGEFSIVDYDMFERGNLGCQNASMVADAQAAASNGDVTAKLFLSSCPVIKVSISAGRGLVNINFRSDLVIYEGAVDQFTPSMKYFGSIEQVRQSLRNVRYRLSPSMRTFNYLAGLETITVSVDDGGFSGADPVGQFENVAASSTIVVPIKILPINNPPQVLLPSSSGGSFQTLENTITLMRGMLPSGLQFSVTDIDSEECSGVISVSMSVNFGHLDISFLKNQPILGRIQNLKLAEPVLPIPTEPAYCHVLSFAANIADIEEILSKIEYKPPSFINSEMLDPNVPALLTVSASDRNVLDGTFNCGRQLPSSPTFVRSTSQILIKPINHAPYATFSLSALANSHFEAPSLCGGRQFYSILGDLYSWKSNDAYVSNGAVDSSIVNTPAYYPGSEIGSDTDLVPFDKSQGTQWVTIIRRGFIKQSFSILLAPDGFYFIQLYISRPSPPAVASSCEISIIHRNGSVVQRTFINDLDIQSQAGWVRVQTPSFSGSSCGYTSVDTFDPVNSCGVLIRSVPNTRGEGWGFAVDAVVLAFDKFQSIEGARIALGGFQAIDPDINSFSLASWASANVPLQLKVSLSVAHGSLFFQISPGILNASTLARSFPRGCNTSWCFEDVCSSRFRVSNSSAPNCFSKGVILFADCTLDQMRTFRSQCEASNDVPVIGLKYPPTSKLTWNSLQPGASPLPCPDGWSLLEDDSFLLKMQSKKACVNMGLSQLKGSFLSGAVSAVLVGSPKAINDVLSTLTYVPMLYYNSQSNRGSENLVVDVNDLGHSGKANEPVLSSLTFFPIFVIAINNPPRIDALIPKLVLKEDAGLVPITFLAFNDVDSEDAPGVAVSLKLRCSHCSFSLNPNDILFANGVVQAQIGDKFIHFQGRLPSVQSVFQSQSVFYKSFQDYFGEDVIVSELNDRGGSGLGNFETVNNLPPSTPLTNTPLIVTYDFPIFIEPVNDISILLLADEASGTRLPLSQSGEVAILPLLRKQGTPEAFSYIFVEDVDSDVGVSISLSCQNGIWSSAAPSVKHITEDDGRTVSIVSGNRTEINIWLKALNYIADETFLGSEDIVVKLTDNVTDPVTSAAPTTLKIIIPISVLPIIRCLFDDCKTCIQQKNAKYSCGWCPSACNGQGRCIEADLSQENPKFGACPPLPNGQKWMMCEPPETDLVTPVVLGYSLVTIVAIGCVAFFYSYRSNYGSLRSSIRSKYRIIRTFARDFNILPHKDFQFVKLFVVASCGAVAIVVPTILGLAPMTGFNELLTGTSSLTIKSDHCDIMFKDEFASNGPVIRLNWEYYQDPAITILTNFCSPYQTLSVVNNRPPATKYQDYFCKLTFFSRASPTELFPSLYITALGDNPTTLNDFSRSSPVPLGPNVLSVDGTWANVNLRGLAAGQVLVPSLQRGYINLVNVTAMKYKIRTVDAPVFIQTPSAKPARIAASNPFMDFCFVHNAAKAIADSAARDFRQRISVCKETCLNATYETGKILPPCGEYVFPNCTDPPTMMHDVPHFHPLIPGSNVYNVNVSCFLKCSPAAPNAEVPPVLLAPAVVNSPNPYDVQISTETGKITFITAGKAYPPSSSATTQALMPFSTVPNISPSDLSVLNTMFHPFGSGTFPSADIIRIVFVGPGAPLGFFVWSVDPRYLLLPLELLDAASFGLLVPTQSIVRLAVSSTSCPPYDPVRGGPDLIAFYSIIFQGINNQIVPNSLIAFNDGITPGSYDQFYFDESVKSVQMRPLRISDNSFLNVLFVLGIVVPIGVGFICSVAAVLKFRAAKLLLVRSACENEARSIQMKTAGLGGAGSESVEELVTDAMRSRFDRKIGLFYAVEYLWVDPDADQSLLSKIFVSFTHCLVVAVVITPMVVFAELYQKSFISNNCPYVLNPDSCQQTITIVMQASSALVKIFPIAAALELVCYNARFSHSLLRRAVYVVFCASLAVVACVSIACVMALVLWTSFAVVTDPEKVIPFLVGGLSTIAHALRLYPLAAAAREKVRKALQQRSLQVTARLAGTLPLPLMANIVHRQVSQFLEAQNLSLRAITKLLISSILALILVISLLLLSLSAFSAPSIIMCIVGSCSVVCAAVVAHRLSAARFRIDDDNLNAMAASSVVGVKKSLDFVLRQMSQAARLLKAMEGDLISAVNDDSDDRSSLLDKQKSYKQAAQMAIMHDDVARTGKRPPAPPASKPPIPRLWRQRPVAQPPAFSPTQLPLPPHVQQQVQAAVDALQAEARWPGVRASGAGVSERQIRLGIRTARALAEDLPPAVAQGNANAASVEDAFAAGVGRIEPDARRGAFQRLVRTRTVRALSEQNIDSDANANANF